MSECTEELVSLMRKHFNYLFAQYRFKVIHAESYWEGEYCFIVLESSVCRVQMDYQLGSIDLYFGTLSAPLSMAEEGLGYDGWYSVRHVVDFLEDKPTNLAEILAEGKVLRSLSTSDRLAYWSARLEPVCEEVIDLFREESVEQRKRLDEYIKQSLREIRRQLNE